MTRSSPSPDEHLVSARSVAQARPLPFDFFRTWFLLGIQSFGGGTTTLLLIQRTVVEQRKWLTQDEFTRAWAVCQIAPGINLLSVTILIGWRLRRALGVVLALSGLLLPSVSVTILLTALYAEVEALPLVQAALRGVIPATVGLGLLLGARLAQPLLRVSWREGIGSFAISTAILAGSALLLGFANVSVLWLPWRKKDVQRRERRMRRFTQIWWPTIRPWSYTAAVIPVLLGASVAAYDRALHWWLLVLCLIGSIAIQAGTNLVNEYFDDRKGIDKVQVYGIGGAIQRGELQPWHVLLAGGLAFAIGSAIGLYLVSVTGPFIFWLGLASVLVGILYTAGPFPLAYIGLGEIAVFTFMGPVIVSGSYYVQVGAITWPVLLTSLPVGFLVAAILHANNLRDLDIDRQFGKRTLATLLGRSGANVEYYVLIGATYVSLAITVVIGIAPILTLITLITLPTAVRLMRIVATESQPQTLQPVLRQTARLHMQFGCLFIVGWIAALLINGFVTV